MTYDQCLDELVVLLRERGITSQREGGALALDYGDLVFSLEANPVTLEWELTIFNRNIRDDVDRDYGEGVTVSTMMCSDGVVAVETRILADWIARFIEHIG